MDARFGTDLSALFLYMVSHQLLYLFSDLFAEDDKERTGAEKSMNPKILNAFPFGEGVSCKADG